MWIIPDPERGILTMSDPKDDRTPGHKPLLKLWSYDKGDGTKRYRCALKYPLATASMANLFGDGETPEAALEALKAQVLKAVSDLSYVSMLVELAIQEDMDDDTRGHLS